MELNTILSDCTTTCGLKYVGLLSNVEFTPTSSYAADLNDINPLFVVAQQKIINYEKSQPSSIDNPVVDPNFNTMRSKDTESSTATYIVIGLLIAATIIPLATWWYFSK